MERIPSEPTPEKKVDTWTKLKKLPKESEATYAELKRLMEIPLTSYQGVYDRQSPQVQNQLEDEYDWLTQEAYAGRDREGAKRRLEEFFEHLNMLEQMDKQGSLE